MVRISDRTISTIAGMCVASAGLMLGMAVALFGLAACASSDATATITDGDTKVDREFVRSAEVELGEAGGAPDGWERGVVTGMREDPWNIAVMTIGDGTVLHRSWGCEQYDHEALLVLVDVGDMIQWSTTDGDGGIDDRVCSDEVELVRKAVAGGDG